MFAHFSYDLLELFSLQQNEHFSMRSNITWKIEGSIKIQFLFKVHINYIINDFVSVKMMHKRN